MENVATKNILIRNITGVYKVSIIGDKMQLLHVCSYYIGNKIYKNLVDKLSNKGIEQLVYIPIKDSKLIGANEIMDKSNVDYYYSNILKKKDKYFYKAKIKKQFKDILNKLIDTNFKPDIIHAHTLFSDGGTAYLLKREYNINYIINIRNTDINTFYKYGLHLRSFIHKVLREASQIIFLSPKYKETFLSFIPPEFKKRIQYKCIVIPNGINDYWFDEQGILPERIVNKESEINLIQVGAIEKNKNYSKTIEVVKEMTEMDFSIKLNIIGDGNERENILNLIKEQNIEENVVYHGFIENKYNLDKLYSKSDIFIMPSFKETFGLVYVEALSRGLPIIYTRGQGIDGYFNEGEVGYSVNPFSSEEIENSIIKIVDNYNEITLRAVAAAQNFKWDDIAEDYLEKYIEFKGFEM